MNRNVVSRKIKQSVTWCIIIILALFFLFPLYWMFTTSIKNVDEIFAFPPKLVPSSISFASYAEAWTMLDFNGFLLNTMKIVIFNILLGVGISSLVAYGFARFKFRGRNVLFLMVLATMIIPNEILILPQYLEFNLFGWINSHLPLIVPFVMGNSFFIFLIRQYLMGVPYELDEAAIIDGCNHLQVFTRVLFPLIVPVLATCIVFQFMATWNDYMGPLIYVQTQEKWTFALGISSIIGSSTTQKIYSDINWGHKMAMATIFSAIPLLVYFFAQDKLIGGIATSGIKG